MYRILIADDEGIMLESLKNIISSNYGNECEIHTAKTGRVVVRRRRNIRRISAYGHSDAGLKWNQNCPGNSKFNRSVVFVIIVLSMINLICQGSGKSWSYGISYQSR